MKILYRLIQLLLLLMVLLVFLGNYRPTVGWICDKLHSTTCQVFVGR